MILSFLSLVVISTEPHKASSTKITKVKTNRPPSLRSDVRTFAFVRARVFVCGFMSLCFPKAADVEYIFFFIPWLPFTFYRTRVKERKTIRNETMTRGGNAISSEILEFLLFLFAFFVLLITRIIATFCEHSQSARNCFFQNFLQPDAYFSYFLFINQCLNGSSNLGSNYTE